MSDAADAKLPSADQLARMGTTKTQAWIAKMLRAPGDGCIFWPFARNTWGYGKLRLNKKWWGSHRFICERVHGAPPFDGALALHSCGNGHLGCVNPKHLRWGTAKENTADAIRAGNLGAGEINSNAKLNTEIVKEMRALHTAGRSYRSLSRQFGVTDGAVRMAIRGETWAHVQ